jgi:hypothetical protein
MHLLIVGIVATTVLFAGFIFGMLIISKRADAAMQDAVQNFRDKGLL